jgi:hypothetical protein
MLGLCLAAAGAAQLGGCGGDGQAGDAEGRSEPVATLSDGLTTQSFLDYSTPFMTVELMICTTTSALTAQTVDCTVDAGFALVGGGARVIYSGIGALLTESRPLDDRTWRASSDDHITANSHNLAVYALGLRLDGVNAKTLRDQLGQWGTFAFGNTVQGVGQNRMISGGGRATGASRFLVKSAPQNGWTIAVKDHINPAGGGVSLWQTNLPNGIIEGFGALEIVQRTGATATVSSGVATATSQATPFFTVLGYGGEATWTSGPGRLLFGLGPNGIDYRQVRVETKDHSQTSAGTAKVYWTEGRKVPGSHGLCSTGTALATSMDSCVASICAARPSCCSTSWDSSCVSRVTSICGKSCANHTCSIPAFDGAWWTTPQGDPPSYPFQTNNCYNYATNTAKSTPSQPGRASGYSCDDDSDPDCLGDWSKISMFARNDGLIPITKTGTCPDNRAKIALALDPNDDYHWFRKDSNGTWSHKPGTLPPTNTDWSSQTITDPETADRGVYTEFGGYFCACSSSTQGQGHSVIE